MNFADEIRPEWIAPSSGYRSAPFWSWNSKLEPARLCRQIESMHAAGMGGFFMHSRYGLKTPYLSKEWFDCISTCIEKARELGMKAYLYDEDRWPSGTAGGAVTRDNPEYRIHYLTMADPGDEPEDGQRIAVFALTLDQQGQLATYQALDEPADVPQGTVVKVFDVIPAPGIPWYNDGGYLDTMSAEAVGEFIHLTHQEYADRYKKDFGELVPAIFTDEPNNGVGPWGGGVDSAAVKWTPELPRAFIQRRGYDLREHLPELFYRSGGDAFSTVRRDFHCTCTELFAENFSGQIGRWCEKHNLALTGHMLAEGSLASQTKLVGACMPHYEHMQWPGIDILRDQAEELITAKQCSSVSAQLDKERTLSELQGCTGWDWPLEGHKFIGDWHLAAGINFRCPHLTHYGLAGGAKRDYPASIRDHSPWWKHYRTVEDYFARLNLMLTQGRPLRDVLVIHPVETAWGLATATDDKPVSPYDQALNSIAFSLTGRHHDWDFGDESLLEKHAKATREGLQVGQMRYRVVVVPPAMTLRETTVQLLDKFLASGGKVLIVGEAPQRIDARPVEEGQGITDRLAGVHHCSGPETMPEALEKLLQRRLSVQVEGEEGEADFVWTMLREVRGGQVLFVQSHDRQSPRRLKVTPLGRKPVLLWDPMDGSRYEVPHEVEGDYVSFTLEVPPTGSLLVSLGLTDADATALPEAPVIEEVRELSGPFPITRSEPNTLPLDYCRYVIDDGEPSELVPMDRADDEVRGAFGLEPREARGQQPWYLYGTGVIDTEVRGQCKLLMNFHVTARPSKIGLALESPEDFQVLVNGEPVGAAVGYATDDGFWVDEDIRLLYITDHVRTGENEIALEFPYRPNVEIEPLYLVGDFGTRNRTDGNRMPEGMTLVEPPEMLQLGDWCDQGLDFYGGAVRYRMTVDKPSGKRVVLRLPEVACTAAVIHAGGKEFVLPWAPMEADITDGLNDGPNTVDVEVIGGRKNVLGPLHVPWKAWTGPGEFRSTNPDHTDEYLLNPHGLMAAVVVEVRG
ncbi:MAG: glycosyl hydrolase [Phycisphaerae bacterium]